MKIIIDIPEDMRTNIIEDNCSMAEMRLLLSIIKNGTEPRKGRWIDKRFGFVECSECGYVRDGSIDNEGIPIPDNFCANCGADMTEPTKADKE